MRGSACRALLLEIVPGDSAWRKTRSIPAAMRLTKRGPAAGLSPRSAVYALRGLC